jgi:hypothetical protein
MTIELPFEVISENPIAEESAPIEEAESTEPKKPRRPKKDKPAKKAE